MARPANRRKDPHRALGRRRAAGPDGRPQHAWRARTVRRRTVFLDPAAQLAAQLCWSCCEMGPRRNRWAPCGEGLHGDLPRERAQISGVDDKPRPRQPRRRDRARKDDRSRRLTAVTNVTDHATRFEGPFLRVFVRRPRAVTSISDPSILLHVARSQEVGRATARNQLLLNGGRATPASYRGVRPQSGPAQRHRSSKPQGCGKRYNIDVVRIMSDQQVAGLRPLADRRTRGKDMCIGGVEAQVLRPTIAEAEGEPITIRVRESGSAKLVANRRRVEGKSTAEGPVRVRSPGCSDTAEPRSVPLLWLITQSGAVG